MAVAGVAPFAASPADASARPGAAVHQRAAGAPLVLTVRNQQQLRDAVARTNRHSGKDRIKLARSIKLADATGSGPRGGDLDVSDDLVVLGNKHEIDGGGFDRIFDVAPRTRLEVHDLTLSNGSPAAGQHGGAVRNRGGVVRLGHVKVISNEVTGADAEGGGVANEGVLLLNHSSVNDNDSSARGGGISNSARGSVTLLASEVYLNRAAGPASTDGGGGIYNAGGGIRTDDTDVSRNKTTGEAGAGGGILNVDGTVTMRGFGGLIGNSSLRAGGGIETVRGRVTLLDGADVLSNGAGEAPGDGGGVHVTGAATVVLDDIQVDSNGVTGHGGGVWNSADGTVTVRDGEITANQSRRGGGAFYQEGGGPGSLTITGSSVVGNRAYFGDSSSGGAILNDGGLVQISHSDVRSNFALRAGGGIETVAGTLRLDDVRLLSNSAGSAGSGSTGGAIDVTGAADVRYDGGILNSNSAGSEGGGLWNSSTGSIVVTGVTLGEESDRNTAPRGPDYFQQTPASGVFTVDGKPVPPTS